MTHQRTQDVIDYLFAGLEKAQWAANQISTDPLVDIEVKKADEFRQKLLELTELATKLES